MDDPCAGGLSVRERRRPRERRRGTGISFWTKDVSGRSAGTCPSTWSPSVLRSEAHPWPKGARGRECLWELVWDSLGCSWGPSAWSGARHIVGTQSRRVMRENRCLQPGS